MENDTNKKRQRSLNSSNSDLDSSLTITLRKQKSRKEQKQDKKKSKNMAESTDALSLKIDQMNAKLNNMLTKDDTDFIKNIITDSMEEMKEKILASVIKRIDIVESEMHDVAKENEEMKKKLEKSEAENLALKQQLKNEEETRIEKFNELEQYGRRNSIRLSGLGHERKDEYALETTEGIIPLLNNHLNLSLTYQDIDISHRLGNFKDGKIRPVIVKFVRRNAKIQVMKNAHKLKHTKLSINEDLTQLNKSVLASVRIHGKPDIQKTWSFEGKLFAKYGNGKIEQVKYKQYPKWLAMWPEKKDNVNMESADTAL